VSHQPRAPLLLSHATAASRLSDHPPGRPRGV